MVSYSGGLVAKSCLILVTPMDFSLPDFSIHGILQTRILEWIAMPSSRGSSRPRSPTLQGSLNIVVINTKVRLSGAQSDWGLFII